MKILAFTDIHASKIAFKKLRAFISHNKIDLAIFCGDFTNSWVEDIDFVKEVITYFKNKKTRFYAVPGDNDRQQVLDLLSDQNVSLHYQPKKIGNYMFYGIGGLGAPDEYILVEQRFHKIDPNTIFVSHVPPKFKLVKKAKILPSVHIYGHIHFRAYSKTVRGCLFIQMSSILRSQVAILELPSKKVEFINI
ncbi:MAG: metallophosphoesterase family protein [bacterium]